MTKRLKDVRSKLSLSQLDSQTELLSEDLDLTEIAFITKNLSKFRFEDAVLAGRINRTIEGSSTVKMTVNDRYGYIRNSGRLGTKVDVKLDGLWFRLAQVSKSGHDLDLTFESREVAILRTYNKFRASAWGQLSRARFCQILVNEVKEFHIPFICPEMKGKTKFERDIASKAKNRAQGMGDWNSALTRADSMKKPVTIKGKKPTSEQLRNVEFVLDEGSLGILEVKRKMMVCAIMTIIQEATAYNHPWGDVYGKDRPKSERVKGSVGLFQQQPSWGTFDQRMNPAYASHSFYEKAIKYEKAHPDATYGQICQGVQISRFPSAYDQWRVEAERLVVAYGWAGGDTNTNRNTSQANLMGDWQQQANVDNMQFMRGKPKTRKEKAEKEDSWTCMQRLADEVQWRCFEVSGAIYFISEPWLFRSAPRALLSEESEGVDWIDYDYDVGKKNAQVTITARLERWAAPPGSIIQIVDSGVINGKWLVTDIERSFYDPKGTITLKKPRALLPEPKRGDLTGLWDNQYQLPQAFEPSPGYEPRKPGGYPTGKALRDAVLNNQQITFTRDSQRSDIQFGVVKPALLRFMVAFTDAGFSIKVTALKSDHSYKTTSGNVSNHSKGLAVDMGNYQGDTAQVRNAMTWIRNRATVLHIDELIGPIDSLTFGGPYSQGTLSEHEDHIHVAVFPS